MPDTVLSVSHLYKIYPDFALKDVSFTLGTGKIMGLLGSDGAGKTLLLKCLLHLAIPDEGEIRFFGLNLREHGASLRQRIGFCGAPGTYYDSLPVSRLASVTKRFYRNWDNSEYQKYLRVFHLDDQMTMGQLSRAQRAKLDLAIALAHGAELVLLDEPTAELDARSSAELLEVFRELRLRGVSVLFSTRIVSDLERCADDILYIKAGEIIAAEALSDFVAYRRVRGFGADLRKIMVHYERGTLDVGSAW